MSVTNDVAFKLLYPYCLLAERLIFINFYFLSNRYIKAALLPHLKNASVWETKPLADLKGPKFSETFHLTIPEHKVRDKTLQVNVWSKHDIFGDECLVSIFFINLSNEFKLPKLIHYYL